jgi:hypothetical protein
MSSAAQKPRSPSSHTAWQIITYVIREHSRQDIAAFVAANPTI